jgi:hypothetical protein
MSKEDTAVKIKGKALIWMCKKCKWVTVSDQVPHRMDFCKCWDKKGNSNGGCAVDHEQKYTRIAGDSYLPIALVDLDTATIESVPGHISLKEYKKKLKYIRGYIPLRARDLDEARFALSKLDWAIEGLERGIK